LTNKAAKGKKETIGSYDCWSSQTVIAIEKYRLNYEIQFLR
jgi:hypothetical protein